MALKIPMTFVQCLLSTIMATDFLFVSRIWKRQSLKKLRVGGREPIGLVVLGDPQVDGIGGAAETTPEGATFGPTGAGGTIVSVSAVSIGIVAPPVVAKIGAVAASASAVNC